MGESRGENTVGPVRYDRWAESGEKSGLALAQLLTYLRLRDVRLGLLINFHVPKLVDGLHRLVNQLEE